MRDGYELLLDQPGIQMEPRQAYLLGLTNGSTCWGVWVEGRQGPRFEPLRLNGDPEFNPESQGPHLLISAIHPDLWPSSLAIEVRLCRGDASLATLLRLFNELHLNVLALTTSLGGYNILVVTAICEHQHLTAATTPILRELGAFVTHIRRTRHNDPDGSRMVQDMRVEAMQRIGRLALACTVGIRSHIRLADGDRLLRRPGVSPDEKPFLDPTTRTLGSLPWFLDERKDITSRSLTPLLKSLQLLPGPGSRGCHTCEELLTEAAQAQIDAVRRAPLTARGPLPQPADVDEAHSFLRDPALGVPRNLRDIWQSLRHEPVRIRALTTLAYGRVWMCADAPYVQFSYQLPQGLLATYEDGRPKPGLVQQGFAASCKLSGAGTDEESLRRVLRAELEHPATLLASVNHPERSMRLRLLRGWFASACALEVRLQFEVAAADGSGRAYAQGLLLEIISCVQSHELLLIERATVWATESTPTKQRSELRLILIPASLSERKLDFASPARRRELAELLAGAGENYIRNTTHLDGHATCVVECLGESVKIPGSSSAF